MPIQKDIRRIWYNRDWDEIARAKKEAANWTCTECDAVHGKHYPGTTKRVILTVAHLNHDPSDRSDANLAVLCARCHLRHDHPKHMRAADATRRAQLRTPDLFQGMNHETRQAAAEALPAQG